MTSFGGVFVFAILRRSWNQNYCRPPEWSAAPVVVVVAVVAVVVVAAAAVAVVAAAVVAVAVVVVAVLAVAVAAAVVGAVVVLVDVVVVTVVTDVAYSALEASGPPSVPPWREDAEWLMLRQTSRHANLRCGDSWQQHR